jgi:hypothetical protein
MKIELEGTLVRMIPENEREKTELNQLWTIKEAGTGRGVFAGRQ